MRLVILVLLLFKFNRLNAQSISEDIMELGKYQVSYSNDTINAILIKSENYEKNNIALLLDNSKGSSCFVYDEEFSFVNCDNRIDSLVWLFYHFERHRFEEGYILTSIPYSTRSKRVKSYYYHSELILENTLWVVDFTIRQNVTIEFLVSNRNVNSIQPLTRFGAMKKED